MPVLRFMGRVKLDHDFGDFDEHGLNPAKGVRASPYRNFILGTVLVALLFAPNFLFAQAKDRFGKRLIYGGHAISLARALSFNGLGNAFHIAAINGGRHVSPLFAGLTVFAWSEVLETAALPGRDDVGALRLRTIATKDRPCADFPFRNGDDYDPAVILELDYWALMPR